MPKTCSKCKRQLPETQFVKSPRYLDGLYPSCKECRRQTRLTWLLNNPLCSKCKSRPHMNGNGWCWQCEDEKRRTKPKKFVRRPNSPNPDLCPVCGIRPHPEYHAWCLECIGENRRERTRLRLDSRPERLRKSTARHYVNTLIKRGKFRLVECSLCGGTATEFHHFDYKDRTINGIPVCHSCHVLVERAKRKLLAIFSQEE